MDPVTAALITSALIGTAISGGQAVAQGAAIGKEKKANKSAISQLEEEQRNGFSLDPETRKLIAMRNERPAGAAAEGNRIANEQLAAAQSGGASGADLSRLRTEASRQRAEVNPEIQRQILAAQLQQRGLKEAELQQRRSLLTGQTLGQIDAAGGALGSAAEGAGAISGTLALGATPLSVSEEQALMRLKKTDPQRYARLRAAAGLPPDPDLALSLGAGLGYGVPQPALSPAAGFFDATGSPSLALGAGFGGF